MHSQQNTNPLCPPFGKVRTTKDLGALARAMRNRQNLTLKEVYEVSNLSTRFLSEFERGKPNASLRRVMEALQILGLEMVVLPRSEATHLLNLMRVRNRGG